MSHYIHKGKIKLVHIIRMIVLVSHESSYRTLQISQKFEQKYIVNLTNSCRLGKLLGMISPDLPCYPVAQIEPMSCQAVKL